jgi:hypothetical protein
MLGTIKTFMDMSGCVYIIACDDLALERHIIRERHVEDENAERDAKEFLRKFFQTTIRIAPFLDGSLYKFADENNKKLPKPFDDQVVFVVATAFRKNPRRIKQFLNNLYAMWLTCKTREDLKIITPKGIITSNFAFMAKILVVKEEWPDFYTRLDDPTILAKIENYFRGHEEEAVKQILDKYSELKLFLQATRKIWSDSVETFVRTSQETYESSISDREELKNWIVAVDYESLRKRRCREGADCGPHSEEPQRQFWVPAHRCYNKHTPPHNENLRSYAGEEAERDCRPIRECCLTSPVSR